jgi:hypothetical protein
LRVPRGKLRYTSDRVAPPPTVIHSVHAGIAVWQGATAVRAGWGVGSVPVRTGTAAVSASKAMERGIEVARRR